MWANYKFFEERKKKNRIECNSNFDCDDDGFAKINIVIDSQCDVLEVIVDYGRQNIEFDTFQYL